jgi:hypothetical protein
MTQWDATSHIQDIRKLRTLMKQAWRRHSIFFFFFGSYKTKHLKRITKKIEKTQKEE